VSVWHVFGSESDHNIQQCGLQVLLDNVDVRTLDTQWLRSISGLVGQDPVLFNGTILENILYGNPEATIQDVS
jgi:ABC-type multidrug transport system fused ATPase/permease subunit